MTDLFSLVSRDNSMRLLVRLDRIAALLALSELHRMHATTDWLKREYASLRRDEYQRTLDVQEYRAVMARSMPRLRD